MDDLCHANEHDCPKQIVERSAYRTHYTDKDALQCEYGCER